MSQFDFVINYSEMLLNLNYLLKHCPSIIVHDNSPVLSKTQWSVAICNLAVEYLKCGLNQDMF